MSATDELPAEITVPAPRRRRAAGVTLLSAYAGTAISMLKGFVFVPLYFRFFGVETYGAWLASANIVGLLGLLELGLSPILLQRLSAAYGARNLREFSVVAAGGLALSAGGWALFAIIGLCLAPLVPSLIHAPPDALSDLKITFALTAVGAAASLANQTILSISGAWQKADVGAVSRLGSQLAEVMVILAALFVGFGVRSLGLGALVGGVLGLLVSVAWIARLWRRLGLPRPQFNATVTRELLVTTVPMLGSRLAGVLAGNTAALMISVLIGPGAAAIYGITERMFLTVTAFINPIGGAMASGLAHLVGEGKRRQAAEVVLEVLALWSVAATCTIPTVVAISRDFIGLWVGSDKDGGLLLTLLFGVSAMSGARVFVLQMVLIALGESRSYSALTALESVARLMLTVFGIYAFGNAGIPGFAAAVFLVTGNFYPRFVIRNLEFLPPERLRLHFAGFPQAATCMALAVVAQSLWGTSDGWPSLLLRAGLLSATCGLITTLTSSPARAALRRLWRLRFA